jgi:uncharacterized repeat protein (TIGR01451 family)
VLFNIVVHHKLRNGEETVIPFGSRTVDIPTFYICGCASRLLFGLIGAAVLLAGQNPSREYIRLGGRVIATENYSSQPGVSLAFTPGQASAPSADPFDGTITVTSTVPWTATSSDGANLTLAVGSGSLAGTAAGTGGVPGGETLRYHLTSNSNPGARTLQISFATTPPSTVMPFSVTQPGVGTPPQGQFSINQTSAVLGPVQGSGNFKVTSNAPWHAHSDASWLTFTYRTTHTGNVPGGETVDFSALDYYNSEPREGHFTFHFDAGHQVATDPAGNPVTFTVTQNGAALSIYPGSATVAAGQQVQFQAYLNGSPPPAGVVTWSMLGEGSLVADETGRATYIAPVPAPAVPATIKAYLAAYPGVFAQVTVNFVPSPGAPAVDFNPKTASGMGGQFVIYASDNQGGDYTNRIEVLFGVDPVNLAGGCMITIYPAGSPVIVALTEDNGTSFLLGAIGYQDVLSNSRCSVNLRNSSLDHGTNLVTANFSIGFSGTFAGVKNVYVAASNAQGWSPWVPLTTYTVNGVGPDLRLTKTHSGNFTQGQHGAVYTITARNWGTAATTGTVTVTDTLPYGSDLLATSIGGTGWSCALGTLTCSRSDPLAPGASYPPVTLTVDVSLTALASLNNTAMVSGGGQWHTARAIDHTTIIPLPAGLTLTNLTITSGSPVYQNANSITASGITISGSADVSFKAGVFIRLAPEFRATAGTAPRTFRASIE